MSPYWYLYVRTRMRLDVTFICFKLTEIEEKMRLKYSISDEIIINSGIELQIFENKFERKNIIFRMYQNGINNNMDTFIQGNDYKQ